MRVGRRREANHLFELSDETLARLERAPFVICVAHEVSNSCGRCVGPPTFFLTDWRSETSWRRVAWNSSSYLQIAVAIQSLAVHADCTVPTSTHTVPIKETQ